MNLAASGRRWLLAVCLAACSWSSPLRAGEQSPAGGDAVVLEVRGKAEFRALDEDVWKPLPARQVLQAGDTVRTGKHSRVTLQLGERIEVRLDSNSMFEVQVPETGQSSRSLALLVGSLLARVTHTGEGTPFQVYGGNAIAGVRGTEFTVAVADDGAFLTSVTRGRVEVEGTDSLLLEAGRAATVEDDDGRVVPAPGPLEATAWLQERSRHLAGRALQRAQRWRERLHRHLERMRQAVEQIEHQQQQLVRLGLQAARARRAGRAELVERISGNMARLVVKLRRLRRRLRRQAVWLESRLELLGRLQQLAGVDDGTRQKLAELHAAGQETRRQVRRLRRRAVAGLRQLVRREARMMRTWQLLRHGLSPAQKRVLKNKLRQRAR